MKAVNALTFPLYQSPMRDKNEYKYGITAGNQCICCMKPMKEGETKMVHMNESWVAVSNEVTEENCEELTGYKSQGAFEIGNLCAKKMPSNFIFEYKNK